MIERLGLKPDFATTVARFDAWWRCDVVDRPPVTLWLGPSRPYTGPKSNHRTLRDRWLDVKFNVESVVASLETADYVADTLPVFWPNVGPEITATLYGCELEFGQDTAWSSPVIHGPGDWEKLLSVPPDFNNLYWRTVEEETKYALEICRNRYLVGMTDLHGSFDILAGLRDPQELCTDMLDCPELVAKAGLHVAAGYVESFRRNYALVAAAGHGSTTWCPLYHGGPAYVPSCDFWCMVSPRIAEQYILPTLLVEMQAFERSIFHLDGPDALRHLDLVLDLPGLNALQWVFGTGHGPAARWLDVYRRALAKGKAVQVLAESPADALEVLAALGPRGLWLTVTDGITTPEAADDFVKAVDRACGVTKAPRR